MDERLRKFVRLVDAGSFTQASRELHISQPALSTAIHKLERELGATLLIRDTRSLRITPAGKIAYAAGTELSVHFHNLTTRLAELSQTQLSVAIGMIDSVAQTLFTTAEPMSQLEAQAHVAIIVNNSRILQQAVIRDELDMAFIAEQPGHVSDIIDARYIATEPLVVVCHHEKLSQTQASVRHNQLPQFLSYDQPSHSHRLVKQALIARGLTVAPVFYSTSPEVMLKLALLQKGVAALPYLLVKPYLADGSLSLVRQDTPLIIERRIEVLSRRDRLLAAPHRHIISQTRALLMQLHQECLKN